MGGSYKAQAQTLYSPGKVIVADDEPAGGGSADGAGGSGEAQITSVGGDGGQAQQTGDAGQAQQAAGQTGDSTCLLYTSRCV